KINQKQGPSLLPCSSGYYDGPVLNYPLTIESVKRTAWICTISIYDRLLPTTITTTTTMTRTTTTTTTTTSTTRTIYRNVRMS
ncbi:hypothetical protein V1478_009839, partial [Vespula squamosa]